MVSEAAPVSEASGGVVGWQNFETETCRLTAAAAVVAMASQRIVVGLLDF